jgi:hypothetical protein
MIWVDIVVTLLLTLRIALFGPTLPRQLNLENDFSSMAGDDEEEEHLSVAEEEAD